MLIVGNHHLLADAKLRKNRTEDIVRRYFTGNQAYTM